MSNSNKTIMGWSSNCENILKRPKYQADCPVKLVEVHVNWPRHSRILKKKCQTTIIIY